MNDRLKHTFNSYKGKQTALHHIQYKIKSLNKLNNKKIKGQFISRLNKKG